MSRFVPNPPAIRATARAKGSEVVRSLVNDVLRGGRHLAKRGTHKHGSGRPVAAPRLVDSFGQRWKNTTNEIVADVYNDARWASSTALGSRAHRIPKSGRARPLLKFKWARGEASPRLRNRKTRSGHFLFQKVYHPGNKRPNRFLQTPLAQFGRKHNFKVKIVVNSRGFLP